MTPSPVMYCMFCGSQRCTAQTNMDDDRYEAWAKELDIEPEIVKMLYDAWPNRQYARFFDFARKAIEDPSIL